MKQTIMKSRNFSFRSISGHLSASKFRRNIPSSFNVFIAILFVFIPIITTLPPAQTSGLRATIRRIPSAAPSTPASRTKIIRRTVVRRKPPHSTGIAAQPAQRVPPNVAINRQNPAETRFGRKLSSVSRTFQRRPSNNNPWTKKRTIIRKRTKSAAVNNKQAQHQTHTWPTQGRQSQTLPRSNNNAKPILPTKFSSFKRPTATIPGRVVPGKLIAGTPSKPRNFIRRRAIIRRRKVSKKQQLRARNKLSQGSFGRYQKPPPPPPPPPGYGGQQNPPKPPPPPPPPLKVAFKATMKQLDRIDLAKEKKFIKSLRLKLEDAKYGRGLNPNGLSFQINTNRLGNKRGQMRDAQGNTHFRMSQYYNGLRIANSEVIVREFATCGEPKPIRRRSKDGRIDKNYRSKKLAPRSGSACCLQGDVFEEFAMQIPDLTAPEYNNSARLDNLKVSFGSRFYRATKSENIIWMGEEGDEEARVVTLVSFFGRDKTGKAVRPYQIIDPLTGKVLDEYDGLTWQDEDDGEYGDDDEEGGYYDDDDIEEGVGTLVNITADSGTAKEGKETVSDVEVRKINDDECQLETLDVVTLELNKEGKPINSDTPVTFNCKKPPTKPVNGGFSPLTDAHRNADKVLKFFRESYDDEHMLLNYGKLNVEVGGLDEDNAFWDGESVIIYNGKSRFHPLIELSTVAHEVTHALISSTSDLEYRKQSGGINEAFADITAKTLEAYIDGEEGLDWTIGKKVTKKEEALRYMDNPPKDGKSIDHVEDYDKLEKKNVHYTSGIFNKLFFLVVTKPSFDIFSAYDVFYVANKYYWKKKVKFVEAGEDLLTAFDDLKMNRLLEYIEAYDTMEESDLLDALEGVGIGCERKIKDGPKRRSRGKKFDCEALPKGARRGRVRTKRNRVLRLL